MLKYVQNLNNEIERLKKENDGMQVDLRHLKGDDINSLNYKELMNLEDALENGLLTIRKKQMEVYKMFKRNDKILEEENRELNFILQQQQRMEGGREMDNDDHFDESGRDFNSQMPFSFRVQPMQPNLHERF
ncbi:hypothetical protein TSUD_15210 [Trifolium subterraneum]|uniref:K-box domain-containing protein n=1 Tax=Trifolium subterraneum TaxID=3900 RepID=A0A2Z6MQR1_TRISU|nr:hypothetical protein TSUD_15210 [Trifolium subterraneum]